jgi:hypothetical protein
MTATCILPAHARAWIEIPHPKVQPRQRRVARLHAGVVIGAILPTAEMVGGPFRACDNASLYACN